MSKEKIEIRNEFSSVELQVDETANGPRLKITDMVLEKEVYMDPILVECLTRMPVELYEPFVIHDYDSTEDGGVRPRLPLVPRRRRAIPR